MKNEYIEVVKRWLEDRSSVSSEELRANASAAFGDASSDYASRADAYAAAYSAYSADAADAAAYAAESDYWVKRYEELTK